MAPTPKLPAAANRWGHAAVCARGVRRGAKGPAQWRIIKAVARAYVWYERLLSGEATSLRAIAREHDVTPRYVGRLLRCAFLAPEIVDAILQGRQPPQLTLARLCKNLPLDWREQHQALGYSD